MMKRALFASLAPEDQNALLAAAGEMGRQSFETAQQTDQDSLETLREAGVEIVVLSDAEIKAFARVAREDVWPKIADEIGPEAMNQLEAHLGFSQ
jgi:TRAP-type transport system periplasmic protein